MPFVGGCAEAWGGTNKRGTGQAELLLDLVNQSTAAGDDVATAS